MRKNAGSIIIALLLLIVPALANAWTLSVKVVGGNDTNKISVTYGPVGSTVTKTAKSGTTYVYPTTAVTLATIGAAPATMTLDGVAVSAGTLAPTSGSHTLAVTYTAAVSNSGVTLEQAPGGAIYAQNKNGTWTSTGVTGLAASSSVPVTIAADANHKVTGYLTGAVLTDLTDSAAGGVVSISVPANSPAPVITPVFGVAGKVSASLFAPTNGVTTRAITTTASASTNDTGLTYAFAVTGAGTFSQTGASQSFTFTPTVAGSYTVTVTVTSANGGSAVASANVSVADFLADANSGCVSCHSTSSPAVITAYSAGTHGNNTVTCQGCHDSKKSHGSAKPGISLTSTTVAGIYEAGQSTPGVPMAAGYVGANACKSCHAETFAKWSKTSHNKPLKSIAAQTDSIFVNDGNNNGQNDFKDNLNFNTATLTDKSGASYASPWAAYGVNAPKLSYENSNYYITIGPVKYQIFRTQGGNGKWKQRYHTKVGSAYYVFTVQYNEINGRYEAYNDNVWYNTDKTPQITLGTSNTDQATIAQVAGKLLSRNVTSNNGPSGGSWDNRCAACHQAGVSIEFKDVGQGVPEVVSSSADLNIGCEACHGGGAAHAAAPSAANIKNPSTWNTNVGANNYYRANEVCGQCHSRVEGFAHFSSYAGKVKLGIEAPSKIDEGGAEKVLAESYNVGEAVLDFMEQIIPGTFKANGTGGNNGSLAYDGGTRLTNFQAADKHHQQWHDMEMGAHGAVAQMSSNKGLTCFSCHDAHNPNSGNIRDSITVGAVTVPTASTDNTLCLACHAGSAGSAFAALTASDIATAPQGAAVQDAVYNHLIAKAGYTEGSRASWKAKYLTSVQANGTTSATFGMAVYKVGQCISCHMPYSAKSGIRTSTNANGRAQGDIRNHTMKTLWPGLTNLTADKGLTSTTTITSCSACHAVTLN